MKILKQLAYIFPLKQRLQFAGLFVLQLFETSLDFFSISLVLPVINILLGTEELMQAGWFRMITKIIGSTDVKDVLLFVAIVMMLVYIVKNAFVFVLMDLRIRFVNTNKVMMSKRMLSCYMHKPYTFHLQRNTAEIMRNINGDVGGAFSVISTIFSLIADVLIVIVLTVYLFVVDFALTLGVVLALSLCSVVYFAVVRKIVRKNGQKNRVITAKMFKAIHQSMGGIKEVKIMGREKYFTEVYGAAGVESVEVSRKMAIIGAIPGRLMETLCMCTILTILCIKVATGANLQEVIPGLSAFAIAAIRLLPKANGINGCINTITYNLPSLEALCEDLQESDREEAARQIEIEEKKNRVRKVLKPNEKRDIFVRDLTFTYPDKTEPVLKNVNIKIKHGTSVGIMGETGAGKTTLVDLILGLLKPQEGSICYGDLDIHEDYDEWKRHIGYIPQNIYMVDDTVRNNIALGVEEDKIDDEAVWRALESAQLGDFVRSLEHGLDTEIGELGMRISGGQRQRIGIARALYYNPEILFFDEATSALDNETEAALMESINALGSDKTMVIVAHRLTTLRDCDTVYKVSENHIEETKLVF